VDLDAFRSWLDRYFAAAASNDPDEVAALFAPDAEYSWGPFRESAFGREAIVRAWVDGGVQPELRCTYEALAVEGARGVAHWTMTFGGETGGRVELDGILVCDFDADGRCTLHREWYDRRETGVEARS
jgi:ketosteroid isomerase-like protein